MCKAKKPKIQAAPTPPPPETPVTVDQAAIDVRGRERRRAGQREGRRSTILAGDTAGAPPTTQSKTVLGA